MAVNASWPGVSMKVICLPSCIDDRRTDVLRDAAGLGRRNAGLADGVEQRRLAVVDVTHDGDDRRTRLEVLGLVVEDELHFGFRRDDDDLSAEVFADDLDDLARHRPG